MVAFLLGTKRKNPMISAAFPRFAPRFSLAALRPRDWRMATAFGLFRVILAIGVGAGAARRAGQRGDGADQRVAGLDGDTGLRISVGGGLSR